jgi:hypothetical protein
MARLQFVLLAALPLAGCSYVLEDGLSILGSQPSSTDDGGSPEGGAPSGPVEQLANGGFEAEGSECGPPWQPYGTSSALSRSVGKAGSACRACRSSGSDLDWFGVMQVFTPALGAGTYRLTGAYHGIFRTNVSRCQLIAHVRRSNGGTRQIVASGCVPEREGWQQLSVVVRVEGGEELVDVTAGAEAPQGECFDVDDLSLLKE